jgi:CRP-like cAMP-binding protein
MLAELMGDAEDRACRLSCVAVEEREAVPQSLFERHAFGIVRRGILIRQRSDGARTLTAIDASGPGAWVPLASAPGTSAYAATRVLLCVHPQRRFDGIAGHPEATLELLRLAQETLERVERIAEARNRGSATERIAALHSALSVWLGPRGVDGLLQRDIAALLGMRAETVCRVLKARSRLPTSAV